MYSWMLSFIVQNDVYAECLTSGPKSMICDITTSLEPSLIKYLTSTSVMWKIEASSAHTLRMDFKVKQETFCVQ